MPIKRSYLFAGGLLALVVGFFVFNTLFGDHKKAEAAQIQKKGREIQSVQTVLAAEVVRPYEVIVRGRTEGARVVEVRAATAGLVSATPAVEGSFVRAGQVLCRQDVDARQATLDQARARQRSAELQYKAAQELQAKGFRSETQVLAAKADLDQAAAAARSAEVALSQINIRAPFTGVFDNRAAEVGSYLTPGSVCGTVVELSPILVVGNVSEAEAQRISVGAPATARLATGGALSGRVRFVSREADPQTRTYRVEMTAANPGLQVRSGLSGEVHVQAGQGAAHLVPVAALVLDSRGRQGVRYVDASDRVGFAPVVVGEETPEGVWVTGLSGPVRVITVGQSYVSEGEKVRVAAR
jgi:multidrug efflux system membrane fusion protein